MYHWNAWAFAQSSVAGYLSNRMRSPTYESSPNVHHHHHHHHHPSHQTYQPEALIIPTSYGTMVATSPTRPLFSLRWTCQDLLPRRPRLTDLLAAWNGVLLGCGEPMDLNGSLESRKVLYLDDHLTIVSGDFRLLEFAGQYLHCWIHIPTFGGIHVYPLLPLLNILSILQFLLAPSPCVSLMSIMTHLSGQTGIFGSFSSDMFRLKIPLFQLRPMSPSSISSQRWTGHLRHWPNKRGGCHQRQWCSIPSIN